VLSWRFEAVTCQNMSVALVMQATCSELFKHSHLVGMILARSLDIPYSET